MERLCWIIWVGPNCNHEGRERLNMNRREISVTMEAETVVIWPHNQGCQQPWMVPEARNGWSLRAPEGGQPC